LGAELQLENLPISDAVKSMVSTGDWSLPLAAGDDYELCFTIAETALAKLDMQRLALTRVGTIVAVEGIRCLTATGKLYTPHGRGYEHFTSIHVEEPAQ